MKRSKLVFSVFSLLLVLVLIPLMSACPAAPTPEAKTLKIGMITSVTGPLAPSFKGALDAAKPTQDLINQRGGITVDGQQYFIEIVTEDDKSSPPDAVAAANMLIQDGIKFIIAPMFLACNIAIAPVCEEAKVIRVVAMSSDPAQFGADNPYSFDALQTAYDIGPVYDYFQKNYPQAKKIAIIPVDDPGGIVPQDLTVKEIEKRGLETVFNESYPVTTTDFYPIVTKALAQKPDAIDCIFSIVPWAAGIINGSREMGFTSPIFAPCMFGDINILNSMVKPEYAYDIFHGSPDLLSDKMSSIVKELRPLVEQATGAPMLLDNALVLTALMPMLQGIEKAQSFDTDKVVAAMEGMKSVDTPWGEGKWSGEDLGGINHMMMLKDVPFSQIVNGKVEAEWLPR